eukprot:218808-Pelagomonas_calceolata.AAC.1
MQEADFPIPLPFSRFEENFVHQGSRPLCFRNPVPYKLGHEENTPFTNDLHGHLRPPKQAPILGRTNQKDKFLRQVPPSGAASGLGTQHQFPQPACVRVYVRACVCVCPCVHARAP